MENVRHTDAHNMHSEMPRKILRSENLGLLESEEIYNKADKSSASRVLDESFNPYVTLKPVLFGLTECCMADANLSDLMRFFGTVMIRKGTRLYRHFSPRRDNLDDVYMEATGSGSFSFNPYDRSLANWVFEFRDDTVLLNTLVWSTRRRQHLDVVPELMYAISGVHDEGHLLPHFTRGQSGGASGARYQIHMLQQSPDDWAHEAFPHVARLREKLQGIPGWVGVDHRGKLEVFLFCPVKDVTQYLGDWSEDD